MHKFARFSLLILCWWSIFNFEGTVGGYALENQDGELQNGAVELVLPMNSGPQPLGRVLSGVDSQVESSFHSHRLFRKRSAMNGNYESNFAHKIRGRSLDENGGRENFILQERHLRYLMSSTAEQPDNSSRSSTINIWLTILITALAAAILS